MTWANADAVFVAKLHDATGAKLSGEGTDVDNGTSPNQDVYADLPSGDYFIEIDPNTAGLADDGVAVPYEIVLEAATP